MNNPEYNISSSQVDDSLDLKKYFYLILGNWYWFFVCLMISIGVAWVVNRYTKPVYQVTASLMIKESDPGRAFSGLESIIPGMEVIRVRQKVINEMEILKSDTLARRTINKLKFDVTYVGVGRSGFKVVHLYNSAPYVVIPDSEKTNLSNYPVYIQFIDKARFRLVIDGQKEIKKVLFFGEKYESHDFNFTIELRDRLGFDPQGGFDKNYFYFNTFNSLVSQYKTRLKITTNDDKKGSVLFLSTSGYNALQEVDYLNTLLQEYIQMGLEEKNQTAVNTVNFIDGQLAVLTDSLKRAERKLQDFRLANKLFSITEEGSLVYNQLDRLSQSKALQELQLRYYLYLQSYVHDKNNLKQAVVPSTVDINDPVLDGLIKQLNDLISAKTELNFSVQKDNPGLSLLNSKIDAVRQDLTENVSNLVHATRLALDESNRLIADVETQLGQLPVTERQLISIKRDYNVNDQIYTYLLQKRAESAIAKAANVADNKVIDIARVENTLMTAPKTRMNYLIALMMGLLIPFGVIILIEFLNNKIADRGEIENRTQVPIIGTIGHYLGKNEIPVNENPRSSLAESFRGLRTNLQFLIPEKEHRVISITSTISGEGKTFTSINLASIFAMAGKKTLLVGLDLRKPKLWNTFGIDRKTGMSTYLIGQSTFSEIIHTTTINNLYIAIAGPVPPNPAELIESNNMKQFINEASAQFDLVILDTPPFGLVTDAVVAGRLADVNLFVVRQMYSVRDVIDVIDALYQKNELPHIGIVLNDVKPTGYYYQRGYRYYSYGYGYGYGYGYRNSSKNHYYEDEPEEKVKGIVERMKKKLGF